VAPSAAGGGAQKQKATELLYQADQVEADPTTEDSSEQAQPNQAESKSS
jgi:hypothetical protein